MSLLFCCSMLRIVICHMSMKPPSLFPFLYVSKHDITESLGGYTESKMADFLCGICKMNVKMMYYNVLSVKYGSIINALECPQLFWNPGQQNHLVSFSDPVPLKETCMMLGKLYSYLFIYLFIITYFCLPFLFFFFHSLFIYSLLSFNIFIDKSICFWYPYFINYYLFTKAISM